MSRLIPVFVATSLIVAACGGSGSDPAVVTPPPAATLKITTANAPAAARVSYESAVASGEMSDVGGSLPVATGGTGASKVAAGDAGGFIVRVMQKIPFGPEVLPCDVSGTITVSGNIESPFTLTTGDNFRVESAACDDGFGEVVDGLLEFTVAEFAGALDTGLYLLTLDTVMTDLQVTTLSETVTSNGDVSATIDTRSSPFVAALVSGDRLSTSYNDGVATLSAFESSQTVDLGVAPSPYTLAASGTLDSSELAGVVSYSTPVTFTGFDNGFPEAGELLVTGAASSLRLIALDAINVRIEIDIDGNGSVDEIIETTWAALTG